MVNNICDCGKRIEHLLLESLDNPVELKTIIENQFKESCHETSRHKQNNDVIALLKEEIEYFKVELMEKNKVISDLIGFCKSSSGSLQDNSSPWLPVDRTIENIDFTLDTPPKSLNLSTPSQSIFKKAKTNARELKRKSTLDKQFKLKLSNIYSKKLSKFNLEKQLNTIRKRKHANYTNNIVKNSLIRTQILKMSAIQVVNMKILRRKN